VKRQTPEKKIAEFIKGAMEGTSRRNLDCNAIDSFAYVTMGGGVYVSLSRNGYELELDLESLIQKRYPARKKRKVRK